MCLFWTLSLDVFMQREKNADIIASVSLVLKTHTSAMDIGMFSSTHLRSSSFHHQSK